MGFIYLITCKVNNQHYVCQTVTKIIVRWRNHRSCARQLKKYIESGGTEAVNCSDKASYLYNAMVKYGIENFTIQKIIEVPDAELDDYETKYIREYNTLRPNGYNLTSGGGHFKHHEATKQLMSEKALANAPLLIDKYRKEETKGLPMYIVSWEKADVHGFAINEHPLCKFKSFTLNDYESKDKCKEAAIAFLNDLVAKGVKYVPPKTVIEGGERPPRGITIFRDGYKVYKKVNGVQYNKSFIGKTIPNANKLQMAKDYLAEIMGQNQQVQVQE